jgi:uncharacterized protein (UPF0261 family)
LEIPETLNHSILVLATLDTKGAEAFHLSETLRSLGAEPLLMDLSMRYGERALRADISADKVAHAGKSSLKRLSDSRDMTANMETVVRGASRIVSELLREGKIGGVIGVGGYTGSFVITSVMRVLPFGFPKVMVSSAAGMRGVSNLFFDRSDIMLFHSVVDISGLSNLVRNILERAACALWGMLRGPVTAPTIDRERAIAMTMISPCENCARLIRRYLEMQGLHVIGFHANGVGDRAMEEMIGAEHFRGVIDLAPGGVGEHLYGFMRDSGPERLDAAGKLGIPQIISTCGVNHITPSRSLWPLFSGRRRCDLDKFRTWLRTTPHELGEIAKAFALKLNRSSGPVKFLIPLRGWSSVDRPGGPTYDPEEDLIFSERLKEMLRKDIEIIGVDANMEDPEFAAAVLTVAGELFGIEVRL